jgi:hypothetical protein
MIRLIILLTAFLIIITSPSFSADLSKSFTGETKSGDWKILEFAGQRQLIYRIGSTSVNYENNYLLTFDFVPSNNCEPTPAIMILQQSSYNPNFDDGVLFFKYKLPGLEESVDMTKTTMKQGDTFVFFQFEKLAAKTLLKPKNNGKLSIWVPASGDGSVKRSGNIYFSLNGFTNAYWKAQKLCNDNR